MPKIRLSREVMKRQDETCCDWCASPIYVGDPVLYDLEAGGAYCSTVCAMNDVHEQAGKEACA